MKQALIIGGDGGLGSAIINEMRNLYEFQVPTLDLRNSDEIEEAMWIPKNGFETSYQYSLVIYTPGINKIDYFDNVLKEDFIDSMIVNAFGFVEVIQNLRANDGLAPNAIACVITSNAANIAMTHSLSYNCSKAAANMMIRQMAREIPVDELCLFGVAPNKLVGTGMSRDIEERVCQMRDWTPEQAKEYQLSALPARVETPPVYVAAFIKHLITMSAPYIHGTILPFGGPQ